MLQYRGMDSLLDPATGDYAGERTTTLANAVYIRLMTPVGGWWADPSLGSRLHELRRLKDKERVYVLARQYAEQALQPLVDDGRASRINVNAMHGQPGWCVLLIEVTDTTGQIQHFKHHIGVV